MGESQKTMGIFLSIWESSIMPKHLTRSKNEVYIRPGTMAPGVPSRVTLVRPLSYQPEYTDKEHWLVKDSSGEFPLAIAPKE